MPTTIEFLRKRLKRLKRSYLRQQDGSNSQGKTLNALQRTEQRIKDLEAQQDHTSAPLTQ